MKTNDFKNYEVPHVEIVEIEVEQGFAITSTWFDEEQDWH